MKKKIFSVIIIMLLIILKAIDCYAATGTVTLKANTNKVKKGDTFTVTLSASSENGINGVVTQIIYNETKLELVSGRIINGNHWGSLGTPEDVVVICNTTETIKSDDILLYTFKVKDSVTDGEEITVKTGEILLDTFAETNSEVRVGAKSVTITVESENTNPGNTEGENNNPENTNPENTEGENNNPEDTNPGNTEENKQLENTNSENTSEGDKTQENKTEDKDNTSNQTFPHTGKGKTIFAVLAIILLFSVISYRKYKKYKYIK